MDVSVIIPARCEMFLSGTIEHILGAIEADTEIIAVLDGYWPDPPIPRDSRVTVIHHSVSIGQRAAVNEAAELSQAKYIIKTDGHSMFDKGFDVKLMADCEYDWTVLPRMYNLHVFDWVCEKDHRFYQDKADPFKKVNLCVDVAKYTLNDIYKQAGKIEKEKGKKESEKFLKKNKTQIAELKYMIQQNCQKVCKMEYLWQRRKNKKTDYMHLDNDLKVQYWGEYGTRPEAQGDITDVMNGIGACWFQHRERFLELGGLDEKHGSWGQVGCEVACKAWLSGGRHVVNKKTWFAHMFRTTGSFSFPYKIHGSDQEKARKYSRKLWKENKWPLQQRKFQWLIDKFAPVPTWHAQFNVSKGLAYYTDNRASEQIVHVNRMLLNKIGYPIVSVSLFPIDFGKNIVFAKTRSQLTMFKQILLGLEALDTDIAFLVEHDMLYHPTHFDFTPEKKDVYYYNTNTYKLREEDGQALYYYCQQTSGLCAYRELLVEHYRKRIERVEKDGHDRRTGYEPGTHSYPRGIDNHKAISWESQFPNVDIRHAYNLTPNRFKQDQFNSPRSCRGWLLAEEIPGWGKTKGRFNEFIKEIK